MTEKKYKAQNAVENYANFRLAFKKIFPTADAEKAFFDNAEEKLDNLLLTNSGEIVEVIAYNKNQNPDEYEFNAETFMSDFLESYMLYKGVKKDFLSEQMKKKLSSGNATETTEETETT